MWLGLAGSSLSDSSESEGGKSPGWAGPWPRFFNAAAFLALAAARRSSRVPAAVDDSVGLDSSSLDSSELSSSDEESSSPDDLICSPGSYERNNMVRVAVEIELGLKFTYPPETHLVTILVQRLEISAEVLASYSLSDQLSGISDSAGAHAHTRTRHTSTSRLGELSSTTTGCHIDM